ncbi:MAG TPA: DUF4349 domain-containing protein [Streptosporangiaceae bacterium]|nr:DUF4349 domain-containing protein [Streptosporangiaceae bacterium]
MTHAVLARRGALTGAVLIAACLLLAACSGGNSTASSAAGAPAPAGRAVQLGPANGTAGNMNVHGAAGAGRSAKTTAGLASAGQSIIYTANLKVRSANVGAVARRVASIVVAAGGYTSDEQLISGTPGKTGETIDITLKIPVPAYQNVLAQLSSPALGKQLALQQKASDVTQEVANVNSLVSSDEAAISALRGLLTKAASVSGLLQVQQQISADESDLNSLLAQQRALDHETSYATVTMTLVSPPVHAVVHKKTTQHGFAGGLAAGWRAFKHATAAVLTALGAALPFLVVACVLGGLGYLVWRRLLRRRAGPTEAGTAAAGPTESG